MSTFGKSNGGGRRKARRATMPLLAVISTAGFERRVGILDVSSTGVQLTSPDLPEEGAIILFEADAVQAVGRVVWSRNGQCGVAFERPISAKQVEQLRREAADAADLPYLSFRLGCEDAA